MSRYGVSYSLTSSDRLKILNYCSRAVYAPILGTRIARAGRAIIIKY